MHRQDQERYAASSFLSGLEHISLCHLSGYIKSEAFLHAKELVLIKADVQSTCLEAGLEGQAAERSYSAWAKVHLGGQ